MYKVETKDLKSITEFLDKIKLMPDKVGPVNGKKAYKLSKMIKDKYTQIKPHYE